SNIVRSPIRGERMAARVSLATLDVAQAAAIDRVRAWLKQRNPRLTDADLEVDTDLVATRALDSLSALEFVLFLEELVGYEIDTSVPGANANFRTLRSINEAFFGSLGGDTASAVTRRSSKRSLSVMPPRIASNDSAPGSPISLQMNYAQARYWYLEHARP